MFRIVFVLAVVFALVWVYMGADNKTVADYKNMSKEQLEALCLDKRDKTACQKIAIDFINISKSNGGEPKF
ncbi:hypothetical protein [Campylobacter sp. CCUG 57310]|uniref:hypothetical protein n=1 Tax=Campylobacter sp. CCUG 57310 TaxID=2517362 RepID=UPI00156390A5|nr:hypothetical protein [Campylobacter sp. CCUG 57310]QKF91339.1 hypothetical protein CORI_0095 [Campylobacter sp. CCUG 57310]